MLFSKSIPKKVINEVNKKAEEITYRIKWEKNDLVMIDNKRFLHGRDSVKKNDRRDIVVMQSLIANFAYGETTRN